MYFYYFLTAIKLVPKWFRPWIITAVQIAQMVVGFFIIGFSVYFHIYGGEYYPPGRCHNDVSNLLAGGVQNYLSG